uniref:Uncharacterized protein n=1 Tax=Octopus bimaculoides TaxID=37653 RepID=A0A0L8IAG1_OCTBM
MFKPTQQQLLIQLDKQHSKYQTTADDESWPFYLLSFCRSAFLYSYTFFFDPLNNLDPYPSSPKTFYRFVISEPHITALWLFCYLPYPLSVCLSLSLPPSVGTHTSLHCLVWLFKLVNVILCDMVTIMCNI